MCPRSSHPLLVEYLTKFWWKTQLHIKIEYESLHLINPAFRLTLLVMKVRRYELFRKYLMILKKTSQDSEVSAENRTGYKHSHLFRSPILIPSFQCRCPFGLYCIPLGPHLTFKATNESERMPVNKSIYIGNKLLVTFSQVSRLENV
jgi:hypothetical protein